MTKLEQMPGYEKLKDGPTSVPLPTGRGEAEHSAHARALEKELEFERREAIQ